MEADDDRIGQLESTVTRLLSRVRVLESRIADRSISLSNKTGYTKRVRLTDDGKTLEVE